MTTQHTPGPWKTEGATLIWSPVNTAVIAGVSALRSTDFVQYRKPSIDDLDFDEICANARLIAAAPELLEALVELLKHDTPGDKERAVLAIKKATGSAS